MSIVYKLEFKLSIK